MSSLINSLVFPMHAFSCHVQSRDYFALTGDDHDIRLVSGVRGLISSSDIDSQVFESA
jgi:hypothetical protein